MISMKDPIHHSPKTLSGIKVEGVVWQRVGHRVGLVVFNVLRNEIFNEIIWETRRHENRK